MGKCKGKNKLYCPWIKEITKTYHLFTKSTNSGENTFAGSLGGGCKEESEYRMMRLIFFLIILSGYETYMYDSQKETLVTVLPKNPMERRQGGFGLRCGKKTPEN